MTALFTRMTGQFTRMTTLFARMTEQFARMTALFARMTEQFARMTALFARMMVLFTTTAEESEKSKSSIFPIRPILIISSIVVYPATLIFCSPANSISSPAA